MEGILGPIHGVKRSLGVIRLLLGGLVLRGSTSAASASTTTTLGCRVPGSSRFLVFGTLVFGKGHWTIGYWSLAPNLW